MKKLKPCPNPNCKSNNIKIVPASLRGYVTARCMDCGATPSFDNCGNEKYAIDMWNGLQPRTVYRVTNKTL
jgi:hypothetical protein